MLARTYDDDVVTKLLLATLTRRIHSAETSNRVGDRVDYLFMTVNYGKCPRVMRHFANHRIACSS